MPKGKEPERSPVSKGGMQQSQYNSSGVWSPVSKGGIQQSQYNSSGVWSPVSKGGMQRPPQVGAGRASRGSAKKILV